MDTMARKMHEPEPIHPWMNHHIAVEETFHSLDPELRAKVLTEHVVGPGRQMLEAGQERIDVVGVDTSVIGHEVVARTALGEVVGTAIYFGSARDIDGRFKRTVVVHVPSSGSVFSAFPCDVRPAQPSDVRRMTEEVVMAGKLKRASQRAVDEQTEQRMRSVPGGHLTAGMVRLVQERGLTSDEKSGFYKVKGNVKGRTVYVARRGGRVDLSGFCVDHHAVVKISEAEARERHLGNVRGTIDFGFPDDEVMEAYILAIGALSS